MADFEKLGFEVEVKGADITVSNLERIEKRLANLEETTLSVKKAQIALANAQLSLVNSQKAQENAQARLNALLNNQKATQTQILIAQNNLLTSQNNVEKSTNAVLRAELNLQNAIQKEKEKQDKASQAIKNKVNAQKQEEKQLKRNTQSLTSYLGKLTSTVVIARKFARVISSTIQESANYVENLNLFAVAYGDVYQETLGWALDLADGFGLASNEVLKFAGTFRQLSTSLGLVEDTANSVSKTVTQLGYDVSSLFNTSVENAMEKLQSGIFSGNVRPLKKLAA
jgi:hypothetical protein